MYYGVFMQEKEDYTVEYLRRRRGIISATNFGGTDPHSFLDDI